MGSVRCDELMLEMFAIGALGAFVGALPAGRMHTLKPLDAKLTVTD